MGSRYVLEHLARICRVLRVPSGNALLIGVGGSGRQSLSRLASAMAGYVTFQPEVTKDYGLQEWREDVKVRFSFYSLYFEIYCRLCIYNSYMAYFS